MYLKSIEVQGFKSFANRMTFEFHNGITAIVGPNGSGKSNVSDAVRWVLGEQSAKQLRGSNMQDIIFAGTESRKPLGYAYVAITLDNADKVLPVEYEEVTVARRVYRSGESEYLINGTACRLKDVQELFNDTGIGKEGYSIIGQGQIEKILSGKPEERRELFDEAAGIVKYKRRKIAAEKKLENERENLIRVTDILSELQRQVGPLEKQAAKAKEYLGLREELRTLDVNLFLIEMESIGKTLEELSKNQKIAQDELDELTTNYQKVREEYESVEEEIAGLEQVIEEAKEGISEDALLKGRIEGQIQVLEEQIRSAGQSDDIYSGQILSIQEKKQDKIKEQGGYEGQKEELKLQLKEVLDKKRAVEEELFLTRERIRESNDTIEAGKTQIIELLNRKSNLKVRQQKFDTMIEQLNIRKAQLTQRILKRKSEEESIEDRIREVTGELEDLTQMTQALSAKEEEQTTAIREWRGKAGQLQKEQEEAVTRFHQLSSKAESLKNIAERYDGYGNSIRKVMEQKDREPGLIGVVSDLITVEQKYEMAIETALGGRIQNIVTENEDTAKKMIRFLKENRFGRATFLPITAVEKRGTYRYPQALKEDGVIALADQLVEADSRFAGILSSLLGNIIVVKDIDHGVELSKKYRYGLSIVTLEGESINAGGAMTGGAFKNNSNLLGRNREIEELELECRKLETKIREQKERQEEIRVARTLLEEDLLSVREEIQLQKMQEHTVATTLSHLVEQKEEADQQFDSVSLENSEIDNQVRELNNEKKEASLEWEEILIQEKEIEELNIALTKTLEDDRFLETEGIDKVSNIQVEESSLRHRQSFLEENINRVEGELFRFDLQIEELRAELEVAKSGVSTKEEEINNLKSLVEKAILRLAEQEETKTARSMEREELLKKQKLFFSNRESMSERMTLLDKEIYRLTNSFEKNEEKRSSRTNFMWEEYELTPNAAKGFAKEGIVDQVDLKEQIQKLKEQIRRLGDVNVNAIEDYKEVSSRYEFLNTQHGDLIEAEAQLMKIIAELEEGMRRQFQEKFSQIQVEFDKAFKELFGGGKGTLELVEDEDLLESGIRIIAQPPGKKLQNMVLLSGGEKALTAISLLFAIQNLKPSPFCLLDEIEAALDDSNVGRFAEYLHKLTKNTQFIVITHRRGTMASADRLYGITMQEKGVSTLVSVNLIEHELGK